MPKPTVVRGGVSSVVPPGVNAPLGTRCRGFLDVAFDPPKGNELGGLKAEELPGLPSMHISGAKPVGQRLGPLGHDALAILGPIDPVDGQLRDNGGSTPLGSNRSLFISTYELRVGRVSDDEASDDSSEGVDKPLKRPK